MEMAAEGFGIVKDYLEHFFIGFFTHSPWEFDFHYSIEWMHKSRPISIVMSVFYLVSVFGIQAWMRSRKAFKLTLALNLWNTFLAIFSGVGVVAVGIKLYEDIMSNGFDAAFCTESLIYHGFAGYYQLLFTVSKILEFGDTYFIVLRKRPLIFLHWYHHIYTAIYCFYTYNSMKGVHTYVGWTNFIVHTVMYSYYLAKSLHIWVPGWVSRAITTAQLTQFLSHIALLFYAVHLDQRGDCPRAYHDLSFKFCLFMEISYIVLFANYFYQTYVASDKRKLEKKD